MTDNTFNIDKARLDLLACEARAKQLRKLVEEYDSLYERFSLLYTQLQTSAHPARGLAAAVREIIAGAPDTIFTTAQLRQLLAACGVHTKSRNFGSAISTTLTRLGRSGFIAITTDGDGNRTYKRNGEK